jgi:adenine-specific DNA-methyltransferase
MPTLNWIGKDKIINHHQEVPYKVLDHEYGFSENEKTNTTTDSGNLIINGDNLEALKSLLPKYEGKVNCIYIDPPYNTGNESWVYNDNVNSPKIKKWLGKVVGKESEDLTRHDKWLCMMYPRLKLLHKLLAKDGAIFISIDDNEQANLKLMMDEILGIGNFVANFIWNHRKSSQNDTDVSLSHNYTFCYSKNRNFFKIKPLAIIEKKFTNSDNDPRGAWVADPMDAPNIRVNLEYEIINPNTNEVFLPPNGRHWRFTKEKYEEALKSNRIIFGKTGKARPQYKRFQFEAEEKGMNPFTIWNELGTATDATKELMMIFDGEKLFQTPKPSSLIERIIEISTNKNSIILDSFAGSGTTAHAVLNLNKQDEGNRKFILIEMEDYAETITAERVKRVINGYGSTSSPTTTGSPIATGSRQVEGTGGSFDYYTLGEPLFDDDNNLNETVGIEKIREYVWFTETRIPYSPPSEGCPQDGVVFLGTHNDTSYYFIYEKENLTTLDYEALAQYVLQKAERYIIYADNCLLPETFMREKNIEFKKIPRDITRF